MKKVIKNISKVILVVITTLIFSIITSCSKDGETGKDGVNYSNNTGFDVTNETAQTINTSTITPITFNTEITDDANAYNTTTSEYVIPSTGFYNINLKVSFQNTFPANITGVLYLYKNGVLFKRHSQQMGTSKGLSLTINSDFEINDVIKAFVLHTHLSVATLETESSNCSFSGYRIY